MMQPFHAGELQVQEQAGERAQAILNGRLIGARIPVGARQFPGRQSYCVVGWQDQRERLWASFWTGKPGFVHTDDSGAKLTLDFGAVDGGGHGDTALPAAMAELHEQDRLGMLFIDLATRRRLRVNGTIAELSPAGLVLAVAEAFPNCPKYIQRREFGGSPPGTAANATALQSEHGEGYPVDIARWLAATDTFFVATNNPQGQLDCSHRGGRPGFVRLDRGVLRIPDYPGNSMFGTLGNLALDPRAGLCLLDFTAGSQLQLSGEATRDFTGVDASGATGSTGRWWTFRAQHWLSHHLTRPESWRLIDRSPFNPI